MNDDLVTVATFGDALTAEMARNRLEAEGIRAMIMDRETSAMAWHLTNAIGGVKLLVAAHDEDRAIEILDHPRSHQDADDTGEESEAIVAPENRNKIISRQAEEQAIVADENLDKVPPVFTDEEDDTPTERELDAERAFKAQVFAFLFFPIQFVALIYIIQVAASSQRLDGRPRRQFRYAVVLQAFAWLFFLAMWVVLGAVR